jgi:hypothetical protein
MERIKCTGRTLYFTPEGENTSVLYSRTGFVLNIDGSETDISFLDRKSQHLFFPFGESGPFWICVRAPSGNLEYSPRTEIITELLIIAEDAGVIHRFLGSKREFLFFRSCNVLFAKEQDTLLRISLDSGHLVTNNATSTESYRFEEATENGVNFFVSLGFLDLEQLWTWSLLQRNNNASPAPVWSDRDCLLFYDSFLDDESLTVNSRLMCYTPGGKVVGIHNAKHKIIPTSVCLSNGTVWYYSKEIENEWFTNKLNQAELKSP